MSRIAYDVQKDFALSSGLRSQIIWDSLSSEQSDILKEKIRTLLPDNENQNINVLAKARQALFDSVWMQRKYTNATLLSAIIYVIVTEEQDADLAGFSQTFSLHPVFRTRKCMDADNSAGCCMIFVDEIGRVYKNWHSFVKSNVLPKGMMIAPAKGIYTFDSNDEVVLEYHLTPATRTKSRVINATDTAVGVGGLIATVPMVAALAFPIAAPVMAAASVVTLTTAAYTTARSAMQLTDRGIHGQTVSLADRDARGNWLGVATGALGIGAAGAPKLFTRAAVAGSELSLGAKIAVGGINMSSIVLSGSGVAISVYDLYMKKHDGDHISYKDCLQLASSLLVFTHSINNMRIVTRASKRYTSSEKIRTQLAQQTRNLFNRITSNAGNSSPIDITRTLNEIPLRSTLLSLHKINKFLQPPTNTSNRGAIATFGSASSLSNLMARYAAGDTQVSILHLAEELGNKFVQHIVNESSLLDIMNAMILYFGDSVFRFLLNLTRTFIENFIDNIDRMLRTFISTETVLYKILMHCVTNYTQFSYQFLENKTGEILHAIESYFAMLNPYVNGTKQQNCKTCNGYFYVCTL